MITVEFDGMDGRLVAPPRRFVQGAPRTDIELHTWVRGNKE